MLRQDQHPAQPPLGREEQQLNNALTHMYGLVEQDIAALRQWDASTSKAQLNEFEASLQDKFKHIRHLLREFRIGAEEQDT